ncbi:hypothetical protein [Thaumasiovibrio sp. DFM-14]|uniref:hypothetical protein n=1 Tax=Thaumasiovibrio sp. DFM-14 TaxID=3384792 RepID=UPI0039A1D33C
MSVPIYHLPSDQSRKIQFREPTVNDYMEFCEVNPDLEEKLTTEYLNFMQNTAINPLDDSAEWTGEDRRTALWWIFISTRVDPTLTFKHGCKCGEEHYLDLNMVQLGEFATVLKQQHVDVTFTAGGEKRTGQVVPLRGYAIEHLEQLRLTQSQYAEDSKEYKRLANTTALFHLVHSLRIDGEPEDRDQAITERHQILSTMALDKEFRPLAAKIHLALKKLRHGLMSEFKEARYYLAAHKPPCKDVEAQEGDSNVILVPFHNGSFLPTL